MLLLSFVLFAILVLYSSNSKIMCELTCNGIFLTWSLTIFAFWASYFVELACLAWVTTVNKIDNGNAYFNYMIHETYYKFELFYLENTGRKQV